MNEPMKEKMINSLNRFVSRWGGLSDSERKEYEALRRLIEHVAEWQERTKELLKPWEAGGWMDGGLLNFLQSIRDFGKEKNRHE